MAPLPPAPKITEIGCFSPVSLVPFVNGWHQEQCYAEVSASDFYVTIYVKGENLTKDWLTNAVKGAYYNGGNEIGTTIGDMYDYEGGIICVDINFANVYGPGDTAQFEIDGIKSAWVPIVKSN